MSRIIAKNVTDLGWSVWGELGVPSVVRNHAGVVIDPEPLIVFSRALFKGDARLQEQVSRWCAAHADRVSASRLEGIQKAVVADVAKGFHNLADELRAHGVPWAGRPTATSRTTKAKALQLPTTRPALVRLRLRALCGVGARADVLAELLAHRGSWLVASDIDHLGYTKRSIARILAELADAALARTRAERNTIAYELAGTERWGELLDAATVAWPDWLKVFELAALAQQLTSENEKSESVRRVAAAKVAKQIDALGAVLGLSPPPPTSGRSDAWDVVVAWLELHTRTLAEGTSAAFQRRTSGAERAAKSRTRGRSVPAKKRAGTKRT
jgi:hypothetical protein